MKYLKILGLVLLGVSACKKSGNDTYSNVNGVFTMGLGCDSWLIKEANNTSLQPLNLDSFPIEPKSGDSVIFSYRIQDVGSICMDGQTIELTSIRPR